MLYIKFKVKQMKKAPTMDQRTHIVAKNIITNISNCFHDVYEDKSKKILYMALKETSELEFMINQHLIFIRKVECLQRFYRKHLIGR